MRVAFLIPGLIAAGISLAACGGGSAGAGAGGLYGVPPAANPTPAPTSAPGSGSQNPGDTKQAQIDGGTALVDASSGLALYTFGGDTVPNQSNCTGGCLAIWPAHAATSGEKATGNFSIFTRPGGSLQWAYKGKPLYTFAADTPNANGTGNGLQGFTIARP